MALTPKARTGVIDDPAHWSLRIIDAVALLRLLSIRPEVKLSKQAVLWRIVVEVEFQGPGKKTSAGPAHVSGRAAVSHQKVCFDCHVSAKSARPANCRFNDMTQMMGCARRCTPPQLRLSNLRRYLTTLDQIATERICNIRGNYQL